VTAPLQLVLATANGDKAAEIAAIFAARGLGDSIELVARPNEVPDVEETGETLEENARLKAQVLASATGMPAVSDDTGLEVDALDGAPGVRSARFAGEGATPHDNVVKMLADLAGVASPRRAVFRTVAMVVWPGGQEISADGSVEGEIAATERGEGGFGYDPVFIPAGGDGRSYAELSREEKNAISHRGRAFRALAALLNECGDQ
jgi:XTP/dITP diphosphohydrolase